jgi:hypothetical protein
MYAGDGSTTFSPAGEWIQYGTARRHKGVAVPRAVPAPVDQPPLFVGGAGVAARDRPAGGKAEAQFIHSDSSRGGL